jgi:hypothetical protein
MKPNVVKLRAEYAKLQKQRKRLAARLMFKKK